MARPVPLNPWTLWFNLFQTTSNFWETASGTQAVLAARVPVLLTALYSPGTADHRELALMVTEKVEAFGKSARRSTQNELALKKAWNATTGDLRRMAGGGVFGPMDWWRITERNMAIASALMTLPGEMLAPVHKGVTANARRLRAR